MTCPLCGQNHTGPCYAALREEWRRRGLGPWCWRFVGSVDGRGYVAGSAAQNENVSKESSAVPLGWALFSGRTTSGGRG